MRFWVLQRGERKNYDFFIRGKVRGAGELMRRFQFRLLTLIIIIFVAGGMIYLNTIEHPPNNDSLFEILGPSYGWPVRCCFLNADYIFKDIPRVYTWQYAGLLLNIFVAIIILFFAGAVSEIIQRRFAGDQKEARSVENMPQRP